MARSSKKTPPKAARRPRANRPSRAKPPRSKSLAGRRRPTPAPPVRPPLDRAAVLDELRGAIARDVAKAWHGLLVVPVADVLGVSVRAALVPSGRPRWHLLTEGLAAQGLELSLNVPAHKGETQPPAWALEVLASVLRHLGQPGSSVAEGQCVSLGKPLAATLGIEMQAVALGLDPTLGVVETAHAKCPILLAVGITADEERLVREWSPTGLLEVLSRADPFLLTDLDRGSLLLAPRARVLIEQRAEREGSSMGTMWAEVSRVEQTKKGLTWTLSAGAVDVLVSLLKGRIGHQRGFVVQSPGITVEVTPGEALPELSGGRFRLSLSQATARAMRSTLRPKPGTYTWEVLPGFTLEAVA